MSLKDLVGGKTVSHKGGKFMLIEKPLGEMEENPITRYIAEHRDSLTLDRIRKKFPLEVPKKEMLFFDTETTGLSGNHTVFSVGLTHLTEGIKTSCLFARDYWEERAILQYLLDLLPQHHAFFTYNGNSFDLPRIDNRLNERGLNGGKTLGDALNNSHIDLRHEMPRAIKLPDYKLQTVEKLVFGMEREGDIPSSQVPKAYRDYVKDQYDIAPKKRRPELTKKREERMSRVIRHNMRDTLTLVAVLAFLVGRKSYRAR